MPLFANVMNNLGHIVLNYLDFEDLYRVSCTNYINKVLEPTQLDTHRYNFNYRLKDYWGDMCEAELHLQYERSAEEEYINYLNSEEFLGEMGEYINDSF